MTDTAEQIEQQPTKMWVNAMKTVAPTDKFLLELGQDVLRLLNESPRPEPDQWGLRPWRRVVLEVVSS